MELSEIFSEPLDPSRSIQLNNRYWPGEKFSLLGLIRDAEALLASGATGAAARQLGPLRRFFGDDRFFQKFLRRLHRLHLFQSQFGYITGRIDLPEEAVAANRYPGGATRASYTLARKRDFAPLVDRVVARYRAEYGGDVVRVNYSVRFAEPDEHRLLVSEHGPLSGYHNDEYKGITTIVYLCDVKDVNGAFSFVRGSNAVPRSLVLTALHQCVDFDMRLTKPDQLGCLPLEFRGSIGIDVFLDQDKTEVLSRFREVLEGGVGTFIAFNGQYLCHRGGKPLVGTRTAAFIQPEGMLRHKMKSVGTLVYGAMNKGVASGSMQPANPTE